MSAVAGLDCIRLRVNPARRAHSIITKQKTKTQRARTVQIMRAVHGRLQGLLWGSHGQGRRQGLDQTQGSDRIGCWDQRKTSHIEANPETGPHQHGHSVQAQAPRLSRVPSAAPAPAVPVPVPAAPPPTALRAAAAQTSNVVGHARGICCCCCWIYLSQYRTAGKMHCCG